MKAPQLFQGMRGEERVPESSRLDKYEKKFGKVPEKNKAQKKVN